MTWLSRLLRRTRAEAELDRELRDHLERQVAAYRDRGATEADARRRAVFELGGLAQIKEACRDARGTRWWHELAQDAHYGLRILWRSPGFTLVVLLSLALGIGANSAIFMLIDSVLVRSLPVREPERLALLEGGEWTNPIWEQVRERAPALFDGALAWHDERFDLAARGETDLVDGLWASGDLFDVLGVAPLLGRTLARSDDQRGGGPDGPVAVVSHRFWQQRFGGALDVVGRTLTINRVPFTIVGVTPPGFLGPTVGRAFDVAVPIGTADLVRPGQERLEGRQTWWLQIMIRLEPDQTIGEATQALRGIQPQIREATLPAGLPKDELEQYFREGLTLAPAAGGISRIRASYRLPLLMLMGAVGLVLLIACANIANLQLARANARRHELSARLALGASRGRLARQLLTESLLFALPGAALGVWSATWASALLVDQISTPGGRVTLDLSLNWRVLGFTSLVSVATTVLFGVGPAWRAARIDPQEALGAQGRGATGDRRHTVSSALVVAQIALSLVLILGAGLFVRTFAALSNLAIGLDPQNVLTVQLEAPRALDVSQRAAIYQRAAAAAANVTGVSRSAVSIVTPMGDMGWNEAFELPDDPQPSRSDFRTMMNAVSTGWFATYGTALRAGRDFSERDRPGTPAVAIVNEAFANQFLRGSSPVGRRLRLMVGTGPQAATWPTWHIVGVVQDAAYNSVRPPWPPTLYLPLAQLPPDAVFPVAGVVLRTRGRIQPSLMRNVAAAIATVEPNASLTFRAVDRSVQTWLLQERLVALISAFFGGLALLLASVGLYAVTSYAVNQRRAEIGLRMALGADARRVLWLVLSRAAVLVGLGVMLGGALSLWASRFVGSLLFGLEPRDPSTFAGAAAVLIGVGALAAWMPAWRAARIDPARVLRDG